MIITLARRKEDELKEDKEQDDEDGADERHDHRYYDSQINQTAISANTYRIYFV